MLARFDDDRNGGTHMTSRNRILAAAAASAFALLAPSMASAQAVVIDPKLYASAVKELDNAKQLKQTAEKTVGQVTKVSDGIGKIGKSTLGSLLDQSGFNFQSVNGVKGILSNVEDLGSQSTSALSAAKSMKIGNEALNFATPAAGAAMDLKGARDAAKQIFFYNGSDALDQQKVSQLRARRGAMLRESAVTGYATSTAMKSDMGKSGESANKLVAQVKDSADLRGDVQANTAAMLAVFGEMTKQTALQTQMLEIASATTLAADQTGKGN